MAKLAECKMCTVTEPSAAVHRSGAVVNILKN